jgi:Ca2+-binding EF-hand superfamily protein
MIEPVAWDLNADGTVDILDLVQVANQFGESGEGLSGDVNMDGEVDILDLVQVASYFGKTQAEIVQANQ